MKKTIAATAVTAGTALARTVAARRRHGTGTAVTLGARARRETDTGRWRHVTVLRRIDELRDVTLTPLADFADALEVEVRSAPDGKGSVVAARWRETPSDAADAAHAVRELRAALRRTKQELEIGWQVTPTRSPVHAPALNRPLREADRHAFGGGVR